MKTEEGLKHFPFSVFCIAPKCFCLSLSLSLSLSSLFLSGEEESRSSNFVCRISRSNRDARKTSNCLLLTSVLNVFRLWMANSAVPRDFREPKTGNARREVANEPFFRGLDDRLRMPRSPAIDTTKRRGKRRHGVTDAHSPRNSDV